MKQLKEIIYFSTPFLLVYSFIGMLVSLFFSKSDYFAFGRSWLAIRRLEDYAPYDLAYEFDFELKAWEMYFLVGLFVLLVLIISKQLEMFVANRKKKEVQHVPIK
ncbi:hypothetical protein J2T56_003191 [Natronobacillus azotifigens]|uniref:Uncharacterized protein n=1 Tax=Natronobacillus azotifigens TaxID=472978 RepID=A0A9J6RHL2_9BACI|nr:hypothetical protein [Natronobacillus azotifigens]MCZ0704609.1 hypothetical protein [Natronobacillus azotifigens]